MRSDSGLGMTTLPSAEETTGRAAAVRPGVLAAGFCARSTGGSSDFGLQGWSGSSLSQHERPLDDVPFSIDQKS